MSLWDAVWRVGMPLMVVVGTGVAVSVAFFGPPEEFSGPRGGQWVWVGLWLMAAGDALFGSDRWWYERAWKGTVALLVAVAVAVAWWRHHRWRRRVRLADGSPSPGTRPPRRSES